jgi:P63C domain
VTGPNQQLRDRVLAATGQPGHGANGLSLAKQVEDLGARLFGQLVHTVGKKFPNEFYENIYKLKGWVWPGMGKNRYSVVSKYTINLIYDRIAPGLTAELIERSPKDDKGARKNKLHQWLNDDYGHPRRAGASVSAPR